MNIRNFTKMAEGLQCCRSPPPPGKICNAREKICNVANLPLGEGLQCCRSSGGRSAMVQIFRGKACNVADLSGGLQGGRSVIQQRQNVIILTSYTLEEISQHRLIHIIWAISVMTTPIILKTGYVSGAFNAFTCNRGRWPDYIIHGIVGCLATIVAKVPRRLKHSIKLHRCYNKYVTIFEL